MTLTRRALVPAIDAFGKDWFEAKEGEASIFRVEGGKPVLIARVQIGQWAAAK